MCCAACARSVLTDDLQPNRLGGLLAIDDCLQVLRG